MTKADVLWNRAHNGEKTKKEKMTTNALLLFYAFKSKKGDQTWSPHLLIMGILTSSINTVIFLPAGGP